jgi:elongation factor Ts
MAELSAAQVMALRKKTGLPMMECKEALMECGSDETAALEWLQKKHKGKMESRSDRETGEGRIGVYIDAAGKVGAIVELRCETAPVGKNEMFVNLANKLAKHVASGTEVTPSSESVRAALEADMTEVYGKLRETMNVGKCRKVTGDALASYIHHDGKSGVLLAMKGKPSDADLGKNLAMHVTFHKPLAIDRDGVPADEVKKVRAAAIELAKEEGKPAHVVEKVADGKVNAFYAENVLLEQEHARSDLYGRKKVKDVLVEHGVSTVTDMAYVALGG